MGAGSAYSVCGSLPGWIFSIPPNKQRGYGPKATQCGAHLSGPTVTHHLLLPFCPLVFISAIAQPQSTQTTEHPNLEPSVHFTSLEAKDLTGKDPD